MRIQLLAGGVGLFSAGIGVGGGALLVPGLIHLAHYDFRRASSLSLATIAPISFVGGVTHVALLQDTFPLFALAAFLAAGAAGVSIGSLWLRFVPTRWLQAAFGLFLVFVGVKMLTGWHVAAVSLQAVGGYFQPHPLPWLAAFGLTVGTVSALLGVGCGLLIVPFCVCILGFGMHVAIAFSLVAMFFLTSAGAVERRRKGMLDMATARSLVPMALLGAVAGATLSAQLPEEMLRRAFGLFLLGIGAKYLLEEAIHSMTNHTVKVQHARRT